MLHRFYAHNSSGSPQSGSQSRFFMALLLTVTVFFGLSYSGVANAATSNHSANLLAGHAPTNPHLNAQIRTHAPGQNLVSKLTAQKTSKRQAQAKAHPNVSGLTANFEDFSYSPVGATPNAAGVAVDYSGNIFFADYDLGCIYEALYTSTGYTWASSPVVCGHPGVFGLYVDPYDDLYVAASIEGIVFVMIPTGSGTWTEADIATHLAYPTSIAVDGSADVYITDEEAGELYEAVYQLNDQWAPVTPIYSGAFSAPVSVAMDGGGDLFVGDYYANGSTYYSDLYVLYAGGTGLNPPTYIDVDGSFDQILGIAVAANGNLYITDSGADSGFPGVIELFNNSYWGYEEGVLLISDYNDNLVYPSGAAVDLNGDFFTADYANGDLVEDSSNLGAVQVGYINNPENFVFANFDITGTGTYYGASVLTTGESFYDFFSWNDPCYGESFTAGPDNYCQVQVAFAPLTAGPRTGAIYLSSDSQFDIGDSPSFQGLGVAPLASYFPGTTYFTNYDVGGCVGGCKAPANTKHQPKPLHAKNAKPAVSNGDGIVGYQGSIAAGIAVDPYGGLFISDPGDCALLYSYDSGNDWYQLPAYNNEDEIDLCPSGAIALDGDGNVFFSAYTYGEEAPAVWVDYANGLATDSELVAIGDDYFGSPLSNDSLFDEIDAIAVDQNDNVFFTAYPYGNEYEYVFEAPYQTYFGEMDTFEVYVGNIYGVNVISMPYEWLPGIAVYNNGTNNDVIATTDYYNGHLDLYFAQTTGTYYYEQAVRGLDTPIAVQWSPFGDLYIIDSGDDTGVSVLYFEQPTFGITYPASQLTPLSISNYANCPVNAMQCPYYAYFATDSLQNFFITDNGVTSELCSYCVDTITEVDTSDAPAIAFNDTTVGVPSPDSPKTQILFNSGNDYLQLVAPTSGTNPSISMNFLLNSDSNEFTYFPGSSLPVYYCPLLSSGSSNDYFYPTYSCALPVTFLPLTGGTDDGTLVVTDNTLYGLGYGDFAKAAVRPAKNRVAGLARNQVKVGAMNRPVKSFKPLDSGSIAQTLNLSGYADEATPIVTLISAENPSMLGDSVPFAIAVDGSGVTPTGIVYLYDGGAQVGTGTLANGETTVNVIFAAAGTHTMTAVYCGQLNDTPACIGDGNYINGATSNIVSELVVDFSLNFTISGGGFGVGGGSNLPIVRNGQSLTVDLTVSPVGGVAFPFPVTLSGSGGPQNTSYTFTPSTIPALNGATSVVLVLNIPIDYIATNNSPKTPGNSKLPVAPLALAALLLPLAGRLRKAGKRFSKMLALAILVIAGITATVTLSGCGANTAATYQIQVTGTSGSLVHSTTFDIVVE